MKEFEKRELPIGGYYTLWRDEEETLVDRTYVVGSGERRKLEIALTRVSDILDDIQEEGNDLSIDEVQEELKKVERLLREVSEAINSQRF